LIAQNAREDELLASCDILALHLPARAETKRIMDEGRIMKMKAGAFLVNVARGSLVDTVAVANGLRTNHLAGAALDVFDSEPLPRDHPIRRAPNCILTPHVAAATLDGADDRFNVADDVIRVLRGEPPHHPFEADAPSGDAVE
jgi:phosphoglycerate dehydrogenase-like enzyme